MRRTRVEVKADLMRQAELLVDELLDGKEQTAEPTLTQIEDVILKRRQQLSEPMVLMVIESPATTRPVPGPKCLTCQDEMHYKGLKHDGVESWVGHLARMRGYSDCENCPTGLFPPD